MKLATKLVPILLLLVVGSAYACRTVTYTDLQTGKITRCTVCDNVITCF